MHFDFTQCKQKGLALVYLLVGIIILAVVAGGAYYFGKSQVSKPVSQNSVVTSQTLPQVTPVSSPVLDETANWKTYNSLNNLYSLRYPSNWYQYGDKQALKDGSFAQYFSSKPDSKNRWKDLKDTDYAFAITISPMSATTYESGKTYLEMFPENEQIIGTKKTSDKENVELIGLSSIAGVKSIEIERTLKEGIISDVFYAREIILQKDPSTIRIATFAKNRENFQSKQKMTNQILTTFKFIP